MIRTPFMGYSCEWSPFDGTNLAVATAQWFGLVGNGKQEVYQYTGNPNEPLVQTHSFDTMNGCFDCCWSESNNNLLVTACGDGFIKMWDLAASAKPVRHYQHSRTQGQQTEVYSVAWNPVHKTHFLTAGWDLTTKLWDPFRTEPLKTWQSHNGVLYKAVWNPQNAEEFATVAEDCHLNIMSINEQQPLLRIPAHSSEILCVEYNKYNPTIIATGSTNREIKIWDIRSPSKPLTQLMGHRYAVRNLAFSPHKPNMLMSVGYDFKCLLWSYTEQQPLLKVFDHHSEFAMDCNFNLFEEDTVATTSWDQSVCVFNLNSSVPKVPRLRLARPTAI